MAYAENIPVVEIFADRIAACRHQSLFVLAVKNKSPPIGILCEIAVLVVRLVNRGFR